MELVEEVGDEAGGRGQALCAEKGGQTILEGF